MLCATVRTKGRWVVTSWSCECAVAVATGVGDMDAFSFLVRQYVSSDWYLSKGYARLDRRKEVGMPQEFWLEERWSRYFFQGWVDQTKVQERISLEVSVFADGILTLDKPRANG
jgi:hypothetical protein